MLTLSRLLIVIEVLLLVSDALFVFFPVNVPPGRPGYGDTSCRLGFFTLLCLQ
jgi:hypothetical protein